MLTGYVDDGRQVTNEMKPGIRFVEEENKFEQLVKFLVKERSVIESMVDESKLSSSKPVKAAVLTAEAQVSDNPLHQFTAILDKMITNVILLLMFMIISVTFFLVCPV